MKFSIIIPHYNDIERLHKLVSTIPIRDDIEVIIVDDNSDIFPDINSFPHKQVKVLLNDSEVQSAGACRNIGLKLAKGKWLLFADSDDFFLPNAFNVIDEFSESEYEIIYFSTTSLDLSTGLISDRHTFFNNLINTFVAGRGERIRYAFSVPWGKLISNQFIRESGILFDEIVVSNDVIFSIKTGSIANKIAASQEQIYCITKRVGSLTTILKPHILYIRYQVSLERNAILNELNLNLYQESFVSLVKRYYHIFTFKSYFYLLKLTTTGKLTFFPIRSKVFFINNIRRYIDYFRK
jgi:glycosyltransferase involved in cell wall biosynthesis